MLDMSVSWVCKTMAREDDLEFEPTLSADAAETPENHVDSEEDGEHVRDEELMTGEEDFVSHDPFAAIRESHPAPSGTTSRYYQNPINSVDEAPRRSVPPPLVPPPLSRKPTEFRSVSPPQSPLPAFGGRPQEPPIFGDRLVEPVTSIHRLPNSSRPTQEPTSRRSAEPTEYARPGGSDRPMLERRRLQRKEIIREGDLLLGKLRIERVATEGLLVTAEAVHLGLGTRAQVVLLSPHGRGFADAQEHFVRTARMVAQMQSEHIARVTEVGTLESGAPFLVAEMLGYSDLGEVLRVRGPLAVSDAVDYAIQIAEAFAEAHSFGTIHGNLRPSSLRMSEGIDGWPLIKVLGFGAMAQWSLSSVSVRTPSHRPGAAASSALPYLSPEQIRSPGDLDTRTDLWSLGAILHEMLVGCPLYQADNTAALLAMIAADPPPPITALRADVPRQLESVILRCLQKDRRNRFATVAELARALQPYAPAECQATVDRIVRVMARGSTVPSSYSRPQHAMVHVRSHHATSRPFEIKAPPRPALTARFGFIIGAVVLAGAAAGVTGAVFASQMLRSPASLSKAPDFERPPASEIREAPVSAPVAIKNIAPSTAASPVSSVAGPAPANPGTSAVVNPGLLREVPRPAIAVQRRASALVSTPSAPRKEARADKAESASATKAAELFDDIK